MNREKKIVTTSIIGIGGNVLLVAIKAFIGLLANSISLVLDAVNNLSDALSSIITIIGTKIANKKPDKKHPFGHGRIEYLTSLIIAVIILIAGAAAIYESIISLIEGSEPNYSNLSLIIISIAIVIKVALGLFFRKMGKETNSDALKGSGIDALFDALLSLATLVGAIVAMFAHVYIEGYLGIVIGLFIIKSGIGILRESVSNIIGERTSQEFSKEIKKTISKHEEVLGVYDLIINNYGPNKAIGSAHIEVDDKMTAKEIHPLSRKIAVELYEKFGVILTLGIYASNNDHPEYSLIRNDVFEKAKEYEDIKEVHAFYIDSTLMTINFDIVVKYGGKDAAQISAELSTYLKDKYPDYIPNIVIDNDFTD